MVSTEGAVISTSADTSLSGQFYDMLEEFSTHMQSAMDREEILLRRPWTDEKRRAGPTSGSRISRRT
jgi:hypothetical protein